MYYLVGIEEDSITLYVNEIVKSIQVDGNIKPNQIEIKGLNGCLSQFEINQKPIQTFQQITFKGNEYSQDTCPL